LYHQKFKKDKKMKKTLSYLSVAALLLTTACGEKEEVKEVVVASYSVNTAESVLSWEGKKMHNPDHKHYGNVMFSEGSITTEDGVITAANFVVDLNTMVPTDETPEEKRGYLIGHLKSSDFFAVDSLGNTATLEVSSIENNLLKGDLTVMGLTKSVEIPVTVDISAESVTINGTFEVDMAQFGVASLLQPAEGAELTDEEKQNVYNPKVNFTVNVIANANAAAVAAE
jgi:polyisoprenoid-binding protein YceI